MGKRVQPGERVRRWRERVGKSHTEVGELVGLSGDAIRHFESSGKTISLAARVGLCREMDCPLSWLLSPEQMALARRIHDLIDRQAA